MKDTRRARMSLGLLLAAALVLMTVDHRAGDDSPLSSLRGAGTALFGTAESAGAGVVRPVGQFFEAMVGAPDAQRRIDALNAENQRLKHDLMAQSMDRRHSAELRRLLRVAGTAGYRIVSAQVIARRGTPGFEEAVELDVGSADGVRSEMTVLNGAGLVGRVVHVGASTSTVVLLSDPASAVGARLEGSNEIGVVHGVGENGRLVRFRLLDSTAQVAPGRRIVSFGSQRGVPYVAGVPIGVVERVEATPGELTRMAYARPYADLTALDVVGVVVQAPRRDPRDAVRPDTPGRPDQPDSPEASRKPEASRRLDLPRKGV
ncbi:rod shape-determining protein MreC [Streptosporangium sp. NBC_01639]|uniref:rod shape-determining protein MreC n=1 Tax=unclassified Streptosporangium TaxID=2632669 RepID=UPI002DDC7B5C|nr:rod shape-determining protein MreC [Streptosporangium sp. NBC_01756]WSC88153.1 rod shape-determining protein MreC [Streptosporangium sp. NBC_01756]WTD53170.1 rod shape-determining protein MreC [Streptosporangium sp. NBC_01639]